MSLRAARRRKRLSMTSLIDVIFLLLLFFMLSSTFSRFAEVELRAGGAGGLSASDQGPVLFLQVSDEGLRLNGQTLQADTLADVVRQTKDAKTLLVAVKQSATAQMLTDVLAALRPVDGLTVSVLEAS